LGHLIGIHAGHAIASSRDHLTVWRDVFVDLQRLPPAATTP
jgi:hypothetical protein